MITDVIYLTKNRLAFTKFTFEKLLANTEWDRVRAFVAYDDGSKDGTAEWMAEAVKRVPVEKYYVASYLNSPTAIMLAYMGYFEGQDSFAKIDNDIVVPPGWLGVLQDVMERNPEVEVLGTETGMSGKSPRRNAKYTYQECSHIGGVGLIKTSIFKDKPSIQPDGRFGWTEWQHEHQPVRGWISPDLLTSCLDRNPEEPWASLTQEYVERGWQRPWAPYDEKFKPYWRWWGA